MCDVHWCVTVDYQQIENDNIANQIHGFRIDYGKFILKYSNNPRIRTWIFQFSLNRFLYKMVLKGTLA